MWKEYIKYDLKTDCMYVRMYVCMYVCMYVWTCVYVWQGAARWRWTTAWKKPWRRALFTSETSPWITNQWFVVHTLIHTLGLGSYPSIPTYIQSQEAMQYQGNSNNFTQLKDEVLYSTRPYPNLSLYACTYIHTYIHSRSRRWRQRWGSTTSHSETKKFSTRATTPGVT